MDKVTLDFEDNTVEWVTDNQKSCEYCPDLKDRKAAIMEVMGFSEIDLSGAVTIVNGFINGKMSEDEFNEALDREAKS